MVKVKAEQGQGQYKPDLDGIVSRDRCSPQCLRALPGVDELLHTVLSGQVKQFTRQVKGQGPAGAEKPPLVPLPEKGQSLPVKVNLFIRDNYVSTGRTSAHRVTSGCTASGGVHFRFFAHRFRFRLQACRRRRCWRR